MPDEHPGFIGDKTDPQPNTDYSMEGGAPGATPEPAPKAPKKESK